MDYFAEATAQIEKKVQIGSGTKIWGYTHIRNGAVIGKNCTIGKNVFIDADVRIGDNCKIQNNASLYHGTMIENGVFIGPHVILTNDKLPRAIRPDGKPKGIEDWTVGKILIKYGASIGAGAIILPNVTVHEYVLIGSGSVVTKDVPAFALVYGNPARVHGKVDEEGNIIKRH